MTGAEWSGGKAGKQSAQVTGPIQSCWFGLDLFSWAELNRAEQINCQGFVLFFSSSSSFCCFETKTKGSPSSRSFPASSPRPTGTSSSPPSSLEEDALCSERGGENLWRHQSPCWMFSNPSSNERRPSCTGAIMKASLGAGVIAPGALAFPGRRLLGAHLQHITHIHWRSGLPASAEWLGERPPSDDFWSCKKTIMSFYCRNAWSSVGRLGKIKGKSHM